MGTTLFLNLIPTIDILMENTISILKRSGFRVGEYGFSMGVLAYGVECFFVYLYGGVGGSIVWVLSCGSWVEVFLWVFRGIGCYGWVFRWPRGECVVRKWTLNPKPQTPNPKP